MMKAIDFLADHMGTALAVLFGIISLFALIRTAVKYFKGQKITIPIVGIGRDLPGSVTGLNKYREDD